jgi:hypothetical protein
VIVRAEEEKEGTNESVGDSDDVVVSTRSSSARTVVLGGEEVGRISSEGLVGLGSGGLVDRRVGVGGGENG